MMANFTKEDAFAFLKNILQVEDPLQAFSDMNKLDFVNIIIEAWHKKLPFQNVTQIALTQRERRLPTVQEIVTDQMAGRGGVCMHHGVFCQLLLTTLGYKANMVVGKVMLPSDHVIVTVEDVVERGDLYLVEVGCGFMTKEAIPLDFSTSTDHEYSYCGMEYKYSKEENEIIRFHARGDNKRRSVSQQTGKWQRYYSFELKYRDVAFLYSDEANMKTTLLEVQTTSWFLTQVRAVKFTADGLIAIKHRVLLKRSSNCHNKTDLDDEKKLLEAYEQFFPVLDKLSVLEGIEFANRNAETLK